MGALLHICAVVIVILVCVLFFAFMCVAFADRALDALTNEQGDLAR